MSDCDCYKIGGPFIAEDPSCPIHGAGGMKDELNDLKEQNAQLQQSFADALLQVEELEEELRVAMQLMWE